MDIDCSYGEGGGQVLRTALGLSAALGSPVSLTNIRSGRTVPGLRPQHKTVVAALADVCKAAVSSYGVGSTSLDFLPSVPHPGTYRFDIGTAGSATLLCQALLLPLSLSGESSHVEVVGGTDVPWSPTTDYFSKVTLPFLSRVGITARASCQRRGYFPKGGGILSFDVEPWEKRTGTHSLAVKKPRSISISSCAAGLPERVAAEQADAAASLFPDMAIDVSYDRSGVGKGSSITLWSQAGDVPIGASCVGRKGLAARDVGIKAADDLLRTIASGGADPHLPDQAAVYMALSGRHCELPLSEETSHLSTVLWVIRQIVKSDIRVRGGMLAAGAE